MTEKQKHLLELFEEIDEICKKHDLRYVMAGGSLIGVVRNEGFIPWDDDVDIYMPRDDWNKFVEIAKTELPPNRAVQCVDVDRSYTNTFPRYASTDSCAIHKHQIIGDDKAGEIIDILTLDPIPADDREYEKYRTHMMIYSDLVNIATVYCNRWEVPVSLYLKYLLSYVFLGKDRTLKKLEEIMYSYKEEDCDRYAMRWGGCPFLFDKDMMFPVKYMNFEGVKVMVPRRTSDYLIWHYGDEWSYIPPHGERQSHDAVCVDGIDYKELRKEYMPKLNKGKLRRSAAIRKFYYLVTAKRAHRLQTERNQMKALSTVMDLHAAVQECGRDLKELVANREFVLLNEIFEDYFSVQLSPAFIGREDYTNIYPFYHPVLLEIPDEEFLAGMMTLFYTERVAKAHRMFEVREKLAHLTPEMKQIKDDIERFRKAVCHYEFKEKEQAEEINKELLERYPEHPSFMKLQCRFVMERAEEGGGSLAEAESFVDKALDLFPEDGYFLKYKGDLKWKRGQCRDALEIFAQVRDLTRNGMVQLELDKFLEQYKKATLETCQNLLDHHRKSEALELMELWMRLLPEDEAVKDYLWLAKVSAARTTSELEAIIEEIVKKPNTSKDEDAGENAGDGAGESAEGDDDEEAEVSNKALTRAWERLGYPRELAALRAELSYTEDQSELEWLAEKIRNYHIKKEKRAEVFKLVGDVRKKQGNTRLAFENYKKAMECAGPSYVKTELDRIFMKDFYYGGRKASLYAKRGDAVEFLDNWLGKYGSIEEIKALFDKIV